MPIKEIKQGETFTKKGGSLAGLADDLKELDRKYDPTVIEDSWHQEMDDNHEWWEDMARVDKPEHLIKQDIAFENSRQGVVVDYIPTPLPNQVIVAMSDDERRSKKFIVNVEVCQPDVPHGYVIGLHPECAYEVSIGNKVVFDLRRVRGRLHYQGICVILPKEAILAVHT